MRAAKVWAALDGRGFVIPDDIATLLAPVFAHRLIVNRSTARGRASDDVIEAALEAISAAVRVPIAARP